MHLLKKIGILILLVVSSISTSARESRTHRVTDSLYQELERSTPDTLELEIYSKLLTIMCGNCEDTARTHQLTNNYFRLAKVCKSEKHTLAAIDRYATFLNDCRHQQNDAIYWYDSCYRLAMQWGNYEKAASALEAIAEIYGQQERYDKAIFYQEKVVAMDKTPVLNKISSLGNLGVYYSNIGNYPKAAECYEQSLSLQNSRMIANQKNEQGDTLIAMTLFYQIADVDMKMGLYDKALITFRNLAASTNFNDPYLNVLIFIGLGNCYYYKHQLNESESYFLKALAQSEKIMHYNDCCILNRLGDIYLDRGDQLRAREYAVRSINDTIAGDHEIGLPAAYELLGKIFAGEKNYTGAVGALEHAIALYKEANKMDYESRIWNQLSEIYESMGRTKEALAAYRHYISLRDSVFSQDKTRQITSIQLQGEFDRLKSKDSLVHARAELNAKLKIQQQKMYTVSGYIALVAALVVVFFVYRNYRHQKNAAITIGKARDDISAEKQKSETLLLNILPEHVANELKVSGDVQPKQFENVTVMFTDFVNFTHMAEHMTPKELVAELHTCFKQFDTIIRKYGIEKIKTVGDGYIAVAGMPLEHGHHATDMVKAALEIRDFIEEHKLQFPDRAFSIRIGINSGPVVAGIVGVTKFAYDIWGDTVNVAARMEQNCEHGKVNISQTTYELVKDEVACTYRGEVDAKGKGMMNMYYVG